MHLTSQKPCKQARREFSEVSKVLKGKKTKAKHQLRILYPVKLSFMSEREILSQTKIEGIYCQYTYLARNIKKFFRQKENYIGEKLKSI